MIVEMENDLQSAFSSTIEAIKLNKNKDVLYQNSVRQALKLLHKAHMATAPIKKITQLIPFPEKHFQAIKYLPITMWVGL